MGISKTLVEGSPKSYLHLFDCFFLQEKLPQNVIKKGELGENSHMGGRGGGGIPIFSRFSGSVLWWLLRLLLQCNHTIFWHIFIGAIIQSYRWGTWWRTIWRLRSTLLRLPPLPLESLLWADRRDWQMGLTSQRIPTNIVNKQLLETDKFGMKWNLLQSPKI